MLLRLWITPRAVQHHGLVIGNQLGRCLLGIFAILVLHGPLHKRSDQSFRGIVGTLDRRGHFRLSFIASEIPQEHGIGRRPAVFVAAHAAIIGKIGIHGLEPAHQARTTCHNVHGILSQRKLIPPSFQSRNQKSIHAGKFVAHPKGTTVFLKRSIKSIEFREKGGLPFGFLLVCQRGIPSAINMLHAGHLQLLHHLYRRIKLWRVVHHARSVRKFLLQCIHNVGGFPDDVPLIAL
mmetsp:Transcript_8739/g.18828  ORF Transcript_8739/g.18828 Transcript_8739/m.18828 type:complete len:235 (-) Transcript_8739:286-990(-)